MKKRGIIELIVVAVIIAILVMVLTTMRSRTRDDSIELRCASSLKCLATAVKMYQFGIGNGVMYPQPASAFYGDTWLLSLYWENIVKEPKLFICPATSDDWTKIAKLTPKKYGVAIPADAVSYAGRCSGLVTNSYRNSDVFSMDKNFYRPSHMGFTVSGIGGSSMMACDDNQGGDNHSDGINAVFFDSHVEFISNQLSITAYSQVGAKGTTWANGELEKMDSGGGE